MVPRAIATLISYEAERLTVGKLVKITPNENRERRGYFNTKKEAIEARKQAEIDLFGEYRNKNEN